MMLLFKSGDPVIFNDNFTKVIYNFNDGRYLIAGYGAPVAQEELKEAENTEGAENEKSNHSI
jgi:hypothetical protein